MEDAKKRFTSICLRGEALLHGTTLIDGMAARSLGSVTGAPGFPYARRRASGNRLGEEKIIRADCLAPTGSSLKPRSGGSDSRQSLLL